MRRPFLALLLAALPLTGFAFFTQLLDAQVLQIRDLNTRQIGDLDRARTAIILPGCILEEHGPYLPAFTDGYLNQRMAADVAAAVAARPGGWKALVFPQIPLGAEPYNHLGARTSFPGSYPVRASTLRAIFMDFASELGDQGFRNIIVVHVHGADLQNRALDQASDYFREEYGGRMVHLWGLVPVIGAWGKAMEPLPAPVKKEDGVSLHGGMDETSLILYLKPTLVAPDYKTAPIVTGATLDEAMAVTHRPDWPGYVGPPSSLHGDSAKPFGRPSLPPLLPRPTRCSAARTPPPSSATATSSAVLKPTGR